MGKTAKDVFTEYYSNLLEVLPMNLLVSTLYSKRLLSEDHKRKIDSSSTQREKSQYFLDNVINPSLKIDYTEQFDEMLRAMESSDDPAVKHLVGKIVIFMGGQPSAAKDPTRLFSKDQSNAVVKFSKDSGINAAYSKLTTSVESILESRNFKQLRRACIREIHAMGSTLPKSLVHKIQPTESLDEMLDVLAQSPYWNWFDTRLLQALVSASGSVEAEEWLKSFKATFYAEKVIKLIPYVSIKPFKESTRLVEKFDKDPKDLTISELLQHKYKLEYEVLDIDEGELVLSCIKTGCVELTWQVPQELVYRAHISMKRKHDELSSLAVKSLVCEEADEFAGLPYLWRGQEVGEVGHIEPLPEHVRQEPYSLPQGFQWVTLSSSDVEEVVKFMCINGNVSAHPAMFFFSTTHPHTRSEWQFGIRTTNGKLVGVVFAYPVCISIGGISVICVSPAVHYHKKYCNKRMFYLLNKELHRRTNLCNVNQFISITISTLPKPITIVTKWLCQFTYLTSAQLPNSPRTLGWRKMTSEDVPSALALVNKYSSQFEIGQVFTSEEEFSHFFLCPIIPNFVLTYVVEHGHKITDFVRCVLPPMKDSRTTTITTVVSTHSPVKQLIMDAMVCARDNGSVKVQLCQHNIKSDVLLSLGLYPINSYIFCFCNYKYPETSEENYFYPLA